MAFTTIFVESFDFVDNTMDFLDYKWGGIVGPEVSSFLGTGHSLSGGNLNLPSGAGIRSWQGGASSGKPYWAFACTRSSTNDRILLAGYRSSGLATTAYLVWNGDGTFELFDSTSTSLGTSSLSASGTGIRYYIEFSYDRVTGAANLYIDGNLIETWAGGDFTASNIDEWHIGSDGSSASTGTNFIIDDVLLQSEATSYTAQSLGSLKVQIAYPNDYETPHGTGYPNAFPSLPGAPDYEGVVPDSVNTATYGQNTIVDVPTGTLHVGGNAIMSQTPGTGSNFNILLNNLGFGAGNFGAIPVTGVEWAAAAAQGGLITDPTILLGEEVTSSGAHRALYIRVYAEFVIPFPTVTTRWHVGTVGMQSGV